MYKFSISQVRVDLGNDIFVDAPAEGLTLLEDKTISGLVMKLNDYVKQRSGQIIEVSEDGSVVFDTTDLTITAQLFNGLLEPTQDEINELLDSEF